MKVFLLFCALACGGPVLAKASGPLVLGGRVPPRVDRVLEMDGDGLSIRPDQEPSLKVFVFPLKGREPASSLWLERRIRGPEVLREPARVVVEAP